MNRFRICFLFGDKKRKTQNSIEKNIGHSATTEEWTLLDIVFTIFIFCVRFHCDETDTALADMWFSDIIKPHSVFQ